MDQETKKGIRAVGWIVAFVLLINIIPYIMGFSNTINVTGSLTIATNCVFSVSNSAINFGSLISGTNTLTQNAESVTNGGNAGSNILTSGSNWIFSNNGFYTQNTFYSNTLNGWPGNTFVSVLTQSSTDTKILVGVSGSNNIFYGANTPNTIAAPGTYTQTINVISSC